MKLKRFLLLALVTAIATAVIVNSSATVAATREAIQNCMTSVIPSLMAFMIVASFVSQSSCGELIGNFMPMRLVFNLPRNCAKAVLLSMLGGYPCGASMIAEMLKKGEIDAKTAQRMLNFCINASPAYVISGIGVGLFGSVKIGVIIWLSHIVTALLIGAVFRGKTVADNNTHSSYSPTAQSFVKSVLDSTNAMIAISGFVITFSVILSLLKQTGITYLATAALNCLTKNESTSKALFYVFFDVVTGSKICLDCSPVTAVVLCAAAVSFGGISILSQVAYMLAGQKINFLQIFFFRFLHAVLTATAVYIIICITDTEVTTMSLIGSNVDKTPTGYITTILFLICCAFFILSVDKSVSTLVQRRRKI